MKIVYYYHRRYIKIKILEILEKNEETFYSIRDRICKQFNIKRKNKQKIKILTQCPDYSSTFEWKLSNNYKYSK